ncbi:sugar ABC transporter substrate-binding protein (plasmid) [Nocardioides sp. R1-1]|uniref:sugar ABC transporter substrate-binding protein n=1 Tax=Nocardioides sp. R1-1 TaxID=3383502 RepID=UPI0038D03F60
MTLAATAAALAVVSAGCGSDPSEAGSTDGSSSRGITRAQAEVEEFAANPPLEISALPKRPDEAFAININCTLPVCAPGALQPAMDALGWRFEEMTFDITEGPAAVQPVLTQAIAAEPDVIVLPGALPLEGFQSEVDAAAEQGIKFINLGGDELPPNYVACIQCKPASVVLGSLAANIVLADAGGSTDIAVALDKTVASQLNEANGVEQEVERNGEGSEVLEIEQSINATPADNAARVVSFLQRNPNVEYLVLASPQFNPATALNSAGLGSRVKIVGIYPVSEADVAAVEDGQVLAWAAMELTSMYWRIADAAARVVSGVELDSAEPVGNMRVINESNADVSLLDPPNYQEIYKAAWQVD